MTLSDLSIKNRVFAVMLSAAMIVFGYLGYRDMGISQFPEIDFPVVNITTVREAADPETMDFDVTDIIEDAVSGVEGIDYIQSSSSQSTSVVTVYFHLHRDVDVAMQDVQNAVSAAMRRLPNDINPPTISKVNFNKFPVIWLSVHGHRPLPEISAFVRDHLKQQIETIPGCGGVMYGGMRERNMRLWLDGKKLQAYNLDALDVFQALRLEHVEKPAGYLQGQARELNVRTMGEAHSAEEFAKIPIVNRGKQIVRIEDVATVEDGLEDRRSFARFNRESNVGVGVMRATGANVVQVCDEVKRRLPALRAMLPPDMEIGISTDYSLFIKDDIEEVKQSLMIGVLLTAVVTFLFLGSMGTTLNVCVSIPTSLVGTFLAMKIFGFTVNFMTLLALSLSVGVVVDDAILVLENIYRRRELGESRLSAAIHGANEISFAAVAATFSIAAIFIPVAFMKGAIGRFFFQFGITCTVAVLLSLVVALTITPMLCSVFLKVRHARRPAPAACGGLLGGPVTVLATLHWMLDRWLLEPLLIRPVDWTMEKLSAAYKLVLRHALRHPTEMVVAGGLLAATAFLFAFGLPVPLPGWVADVLGKTRADVDGIKPIGRELVPSEDQNRFVVNVICPVGSSIDYVDEMLAKAEEIVIGLRDPGTDKEVVASVFAAVSIRPGSLVSEGILFVRLIPSHERQWTQAEVMNQLRAAFTRGIENDGRRFGPVPGMRAVVLDLSTQGFTPSRGYPIDFAIQGPDWATVTRLSERIKERMIDSGVVTDVNSDYRPGMPEVQIVPDRVKAAELGVPIRRLAFALNVAFGGVRNGRFTVHDKRYDVRLRFEQGQRASPDDLEDVYVKADSGKLVPLRDLVTRRTESTLPVINRYNHLRKVELTANMAPGVSQGEAIARCRALAEEVNEEHKEELRAPIRQEYEAKLAELRQTISDPEQLAAEEERLQREQADAEAAVQGIRIVPLGNAQAMQQTLDSMWWALALGFVVAYMILGVQFNSFVHPFTVLVAVPFGVTGALATLWAAGDTLNLMSMIGMVLLAGLVKKNSIILVDYTNQLRAEGLGLQEAVLTACPVRLRPIVMTSIATIAAAIPLAMGYGPGAETRAPLARSIIGGIVLSTLVTLVIVPIFYVLFDRFGAWAYRLSRREGPRAQALPRRPEVGPVPVMREPAAAPALDVRPEMS